MATYFLYWALLLVWPILLLPAIRLKGWRRGWLLIVIAFSVIALVYEIGMYLGSSASIRLDIILITVAVCVLYASTALLLFFWHWRKTAILLAAFLVIIGGGLGYFWMEVNREGQRISKAFEEGNRLLFKAKFRNQKTYENLFGPFAGAPVDLPTGHWVSENVSRFTRMIINARGHVWLFYQCYKGIECHSGPNGSGLRKTRDGARRWSASLEPEIGVPFSIEIAEVDAGDLLLTESERTIRFRKVPAPVNPDSSPASLRFLGPFTNYECIREHAKVRQVWLWQDEVSTYGVGVYATLAAGRQNRFVLPVVLGKGVLEDNGWRFNWNNDGVSGTAHITLENGDAVLSLDQDLSANGRNLEDIDHAPMKSGSVFSDERIDLAPLTNGDDWEHWFNNVLVGHFLSGQAPDC